MSRGLSFSTVLKDRGLDSVRYEKRDAVIKDSEGNVVFEQKDVVAPIDWSDTAVNIAASKYFSGRHGTPEREISIADMVQRVSSCIRKWGEEGGYFKTESDADNFEEELFNILINQYAFFNSPVWFNVGVHEHPQCSACFINSVEDDMSSIFDLAKTEGMLFKYGSGTGTNLSVLRSSKEHLSAGGVASGPVSFMRGYDSFAGVIKSGGTCLPAHQKVYTERGAVAVSELCDKDFIVLSYDPPAGRVKAKKAAAWLSGRKKVVRVTTDKGVFEVSHDHPVRLSGTGEYCMASKLKAGSSLHSCSVTNDSGYERVGLQDGKGGWEAVHRLIAQDVMGKDVSGMAVHHGNGDRLDNRAENLEVMTQSEHATLHNNDMVAKGEHLFQHQTWPKVGEDNPMHSTSAFWSDPERTESLKAKRSANLATERASKMQPKAAKQRMINTAHRILNSGGSIDTFEDYADGRTRYIGRHAGEKYLMNSIQNQFGDFTTFKKFVYSSNHKVVNVEDMGEMDVYSVEVYCPTPDDKSPQSGHNYLICDSDGRTGVFSANTRRSAKMVILNVDHPDIVEFIECKEIEENKAWALIEAGYDGGFNVPGGAYDSVFHQNANHSVRVTDQFMQDVLKDEKFYTRNVTDRAVADEYDARHLWRLIAESAWACGDPGVQFDDTIQEWNTCADTERINATNPCSEFVFLDDTACNLASLNLMKFYSRSKGMSSLAATNGLDIRLMIHVCEVMITAMEIIVGAASYPRERIAERSFALRPLGLGYANLGSLLMARGLPYDSDSGRALAAVVTSIMTAAAYRQSACIAQFKGPFADYVANAGSMIRVLEKHAEEAKNIDSDLVPYDMLNWNNAIWAEVLCLASSYGVRNSQISVIAPTGTIGLAMDCDTTGIEPELALVKYKSLAGGGNIKFVNNTVGMALDQLGYDVIEIKKIRKYIEEHDTIEGCSVLKEEHLPVFDCSFTPMNGSRSIRYQAHIDMMAAVQPFVSGAISKTINMDNDCTPDDIMDAYMRAWESGLKCVAIYRDGCKRSQPLSMEDDSDKSTEVHQLPVERRIKMPIERQSVTHKFEVGSHEGYITVGLYENGQPGEIFITMSKMGSTISGLMDSFALSISIALQYGVPLEVLIDRFMHSRFEPSGFTNNKDIPQAKSFMDYIFRWLRHRFLDGEDVERNSETPSFGDAPPCRSCGTIMVRRGACYSCDNCGETGGCG